MNLASLATDRLALIALVVLVVVVLVISATVGGSEKTTTLSLVPYDGFDAGDDEDIEERFENEDEDFDMENFSATAASVPPKDRVRMEKALGLAKEAAARLDESRSEVMRLKAQMAQTTKASATTTTTTQTTTPSPRCPHHTVDAPSPGCQYCNQFSKAHPCTHCRDKCPFWSRSGHCPCGCHQHVHGYPHHHVDAFQIKMRLMKLLEERNKWKEIILAQKRWLKAHAFRKHHHHHPHVHVPRPTTTTPMTTTPTPRTIVKRIFVREKRRKTHPPVHWEFTTPAPTTPAPTTTMPPRPRVIVKKIVKKCKKQRPWWEDAMMNETPTPLPIPTFAPLTMAPTTTTLPPCPAGQMRCNGNCVSLKSNKNNCGKCGVVCGAKQACVNKKCIDFCEAGKMRCGGKCVAIKNDMKNCGKCGVKCQAGQRCVNRKCVAAACPKNKIRCAGVCVNPIVNKAHCGKCGNKCGTGKVCRYKKCVDKKGTTTPSGPLPPWPNPVGGWRLFYHAGRYTAVRLSGDGVNMQCLSKPGEPNSCIWEPLEASPLDAMRKMAINIKEYGGNQSNLTCGTAHKQAHGSTGLESGLGWCALSKIWATGKQLKDRTADAGKWKPMEVGEGFWMPVRLSEDSENPECLSVDGTKCIMKSSKEKLEDEVKKREIDEKSKTIKCDLKDYKKQKHWCVQARQGVAEKRSKLRFRNFEAVYLGKKRYLALRMSRNGNELECLRDGNAQCATRERRADMNKVILAFMAGMNDGKALQTTVCQPNHKGEYPFDSWCTQKYLFLGYDYKPVKLGKDYSNKYIAIRETHEGNIEGLSRDGTQLMNANSAAAMMKLVAGYAIYSTPVVFTAEANPKIYPVAKAALEKSITRGWTQRPFITEDETRPKISFFADDEEFEEGDEEESFYDGPELFRPEPFEGLESFGVARPIVKNWKWGEERQKTRAPTTIRAMLQKKSAPTKAAIAARARNLTTIRAILQKKANAIKRPTTTTTKKPATAPKKVTTLVTLMKRLQGTKRPTTTMRNPMAGRTTTPKKKR